MASTESAPVPPRPRRKLSRLAGVSARRHSPLRRTSDTLRFWLRTLLVLGLVAVAAVSAAVGLADYHHERAAAALEAARLHRVQAVATTDAAQPTGPAVGYADATATVRWTYPADVPHQESASVPSGTVSGQQVTLWLDTAGRPADPPASPALSADNADFLAASCWIGFSGTLIAGVALGQRLVNNADLRRWEQEWKRVEPQWTRQH